MIKTYSVLEKLQAAVDKHRNRVKRAEERVLDLREQYKTAHWSKQRDIAGKGFRAVKAFEKAVAERDQALAALKAEETRLLGPDAFLRFD